MQYQFKKQRNPLHKTVTDIMLHGPCASGWACRRDGQHCRYGYPKDFQEETDMSEEGTPRYRRREPGNGGNCYVRQHRNKNNTSFTNANVVPYNKYLLFKYNCHINVEYVNSIGAIKYHLKYVFKGSDRATVSIDDNNEEQVQNQDEVQNFQNKRYVSGAESCHRLRERELAERKPSVHRLQLHLQDKQTVYFDANEKDQCIERIERSERTKLTSFFELCNNGDKLAQTLLFRHLPQHYKWDTNKRKWIKRVKTADNIDIGVPDVIGRLYSCSPTQIQLFALRLLLNHVKGPKSYEDIRTVDGEPYETFVDAAIALKLMKDDKMWIECMKEANDSQTNIFRLRKLFVTILRECEVSNHKLFYKASCEMLMADYLHLYKKQFPHHPNLMKVRSSECSPSGDDDEIMQVDEEDEDIGDIVLESYDVEDEEWWTLEKYAMNSCLCDMERMLTEAEKTLSDFRLPTPNMEKEQYIQNCLADRYMAEEDDFTPEKAQAFYEANFSKLNKDQRAVFDYMKNLIEEKNTEGKLIFLDAPGGTGKTFTLNVLGAGSACNTLMWLPLQVLALLPPSYTLEGQPTIDSSSQSTHTKTHSATSRSSLIWQSIYLAYLLQSSMRVPCLINCALRHWIGP